LERADEIGTKYALPLNYGFWGRFVTWRNGAGLMLKEAKSLFFKPIRKAAFFWSLLTLSRMASQSS
jgi:hypothetical protein